MNPLLKILMKQIEENAVIIEQYARKAIKNDNGYFQSYDSKVLAERALNNAFKGIANLKEVLEEML